MREADKGRAFTSVRQVLVHGRGSLGESGLAAGDPAMRLQTFPRRLPNF